MANEIGKVVRTGVYPDHPHDTNHQARMTRRGELLVMSNWDDMVADGNVFGVNMGTSSTVVSFGETAYDEDQPQFGLDVPTGTVCIPLEINLYLQTAGGALNEAFFRMNDGLLGLGTDATLLTELSLFQQASDSQRDVARCVGRSLYTNNAAAVTTGFEFARWGNAFADATTSPELHWRWSRADAGFGPVLEGESSISGYVLGGSAPTGFLTFTWAELIT